MKPSIPESLLSPVSDLIVARLGLAFPSGRLPDLERGLAAAAREMGESSGSDLARRLLSSTASPDELETVASHLTIGETYFFREPEILRVLEETILPELLRGNRQHPLQIWSAGCCTGEEPYSMAMLLDRALPDAAAKVKIVATDVNRRFLEKAKRGVYGEWSFRTTPPELRARYFRKRARGGWELDPRIRQMVTFAHRNLVEISDRKAVDGGSGVDIVLCRNVLMYFSAEQAHEVVQRFHRTLAPGGWLIVSVSETSAALFRPFQPVAFSGGTIYRKASVRTQKTQRAAAPLTGTLTASPPILLAGVGPAATVPADRRLQAAPKASALAAQARRRAGEGRLAEAAELCRAAIAADKMIPAHHYLLAAIERESGQPEAAEQSLKRALYLDHDFVVAHFGLANLALSLGRRREAMRHLANALAAVQLHHADEIVPESDGLSAGSLTQIITELQEALEAEQRPVRRPA